MKRIIIISVLFCISFVFANAQDITKDFFKTLPKRNISKVDTVKNREQKDSIPFINPNGTSSTGKKDISINDSCIKRIVQKSMFILRQDYSLYNKKKDVYYGYNDREFFGTTYSLAVKCDKFTLLYDEAIFPWDYDPKYPDFMNKKLEPVITETQILMIDDSISYKYTVLDSILVDNRVIKEDLLYAGRPLTNSQDGLLVNTSDTCKTGVLIWITKKSGDYEKGDIKLGFKTVFLDTEMLGNVIVVPPTDCKDIIGCLYMTESGNKDNPYLLSGIATQQEQQWMLCFPFKDFQLDPAKEEVKKTIEKGKLTEIKKTNKKK